MGFFNSASFAQTSRRNVPEFSPPVHRAPTTYSTRHAKRVEFQQLDNASPRATDSRPSTTQDYARQDQAQWHPADAGQRGRTRTARSQNAIYQRPAGNEPRPLQGELINLDAGATQEPTGDQPLADPFGDRLPDLRTQHDESDTEETSLRGGAQRGRAFAASLEQYQDIVDPYQAQDAGRRAQDQDLERRPESFASDKSCDDFRSELLGKSIVDVDVNISASRAPGPAGGALPREARSWSNVHGHTLGTGAFVDLHHGYVVIDAHGGSQRIPVSQLGDADLAAIASAWRLPSDCTLGDYSTPVRTWIPQTVTWKASNLCHKPLYFEDEQLERYGHSAGPVLQPLKSTAHFFVRFVSWPYATGIHPPNECQYALGFYRPGNCAPWLIDPIPISLSGATRQALVMTGGAFILP